jgi:D-hydroxyproline dehydrogenase subunit beta
MPDVIVVGGGVIGASCAWEAARRGLSVTLVERAELAAGASGRNHGLLLHPEEPPLAPMFEESLTLYEEAREEAPVPFGMDAEPIGLLVVAGDDRETAMGKEQAEAFSSAGVRVDHLEGRTVRSVEPAVADGFEEGWLLHDGRRLDPAALTVSLALSSGAEVRRGLPVRRLVERDGAVGGVLTDQGPLEGGVVVVAAGPWTGQLLRPLGIHLPLVGARGWLVHLLPDGPSIGRLVERAGWHAVGGEEALARMAADSYADAPPEAEAGTLLQPNPDGTVLVGGSRQRAVAPEPEDAAVPRDLVRRAIEVVPGLARAEVLSSWWGIRPMTPDGLPIVGALGDGLVVATGHGSQGVILGGGTARLVGALLEGGEASLDPTPFRPDRFRD